jgi:putative effector of murein hydrolase LrgA (UPF0299 family)
MFSNMYFYLMVVVLVFAIGDMIGHFTKGKLSGMMMVMLLFLIAFLVGILPGDIIDKAGLTQLASAATGMVLSLGAVQYGHHHQHQADDP